MKITFKFNLKALRYENGFWIMKSGSLYLTKIWKKKKLKT